MKEVYHRELALRFQKTSAIPRVLLSTMIMDEDVSSQLFLPTLLYFTIMDSNLLTL